MQNAANNYVLNKQYCTVFMKTKLFALVHSPPGGYAEGHLSLVAILGGYARGGSYARGITVL